MIWSVLVILICAALLDTAFLTYKHYFQPYGACAVGGLLSVFADCGTVLRSEYSILFGIPLAVWGLIHYIVLAAMVWATFVLNDTIQKRFLFIQTALGVVMSAYLTFLQFFVIKSLCPYCILSAVISVLLYMIVRTLFYEDYRSFVLAKTEVTYKLLIKPFFFLLPADFVHDQALFWGELMGKMPWKRAAFKKFFHYEHPALHQKVAGITFSNPVGLSAGYDYMASFTQLLPAIGFGFETVGTISHEANDGNKKPRLGRLPKSQSLLVNKGFRNPGAAAIIDKLRGRTFAFVLGISIGKTNSIEVAGTQKDAIRDIVSAFSEFEKSSVKNAYYELNISCPNLKGGVSFYPPNNLKELLTALEKLHIRKPVFVKMPIEKTDAEVAKMLDVLVQFKYITGVIFGNLQKDRKDRSFVVEEVAKAGTGHFSGKPTYRRSNELIRLAYNTYGKRLIVIGCGGVFTAEDAYRKIRLGASLIQLITGMIYEGPQRISQINRGLVERLQADGFKNISEAVGVDSRT